MQDKSRWLAVKIALSVYILFHLMTVLLLPNASSLFIRGAARFVLPYANTFGLNTSWQFFSPGPSPTFYIEYEIETEATRDAIDLEKYIYPPMRIGKSWNDGYNRRLYGMRFLALSPERLERFFIPFLCRQKAGAVAVHLQSVIEQLPDIAKADGAPTFKELSERFELPRQRYDCPAPAEGLAK